MMTPADSAFSSMNYFFLRFMKEKDTPQIIKEELQNFLATFNLYPNVSYYSKRAAVDEIVQGEYFKDLTDEEVRSLVENATKKIVGDILSHVTLFYTECAKKAREEE